MELIATVNEKKVFHLDLRTEWEMEYVQSYSWVALVIAGSAAPDRLDAILSACKKYKTGYIVCSGETSGEAYSFFDLETFDAGNSEIERFENPPCVIEKPSPADALWYSLYFATCEEGVLRAVVCFDCTDRGVKKYLAAQAGEMNEDESYLSPEPDEEVIEYDS
ncbi:MAG: hypothetical protein EPN93_12320 [Spirochaetes bacterium]|nr:MAG: hypothetical protein EPN93_12320 [Spirochaetota bacterium]